MSGAQKGWRAHTQGLGCAVHEKMARGYGGETHEPRIVFVCAKLGRECEESNEN